MVFRVEGFWGLGFRGVRVQGLGFWGVGFKVEFGYMDLAEFGTGYRGWTRKNDRP